MDGADASEGDDVTPEVMAAENIITITADADDSSLTDDPAADPIAAILDGWNGVTATVRTTAADRIAARSAENPSAKQPEESEAPPTDLTLADTDRAGRETSVADDGLTAPAAKPASPQSADAPTQQGASTASGVGPEQNVSAVPSTASDSVPRVAAGSNLMSDQDSHQTQAVITASVSRRPDGVDAKAESVATASPDKNLPQTADDAKPARNTRDTPGDSAARSVSLSGDAKPSATTSISDLTTKSAEQMPDLPGTPTAMATTDRPLVHFAAVAERPSNFQPATVFRQIADAVIVTRDQMVEITLSPEELGRVRMVLTGQDRAPHLTIWVERPEVLDQMRRHADQLLQKFRDDGMSDATLSFRDGQQRQTGQQGGGSWSYGHDNRTDYTAPETVIPIRMAPALSSWAGDRRVDIRI